MAKANGIHKLLALRRNWIVLRVLADVLVAAAVALMTLPWGMGGTSIWFGLLVFMLIAVGSVYVRKPWRFTLNHAAAFLNKHNPELEESAELTLTPPTDLTLLQRLQSNKTEAALDKVSTLPKPLLKSVLPSFLLFISVCILALAVYKVTKNNQARAAYSNTEKPKTAKEKLLPQIQSVEVIITSPAYTGKAKRRQEKLTVTAEEGAIVSWHITTNLAVKQISLLFNDREKIVLKPAANGTDWLTQRLMNNSGFYQVNIDGKPSDLYQIEVIKDAPPLIHIKSPKQYTYIDAGEAPRVTLNATVNDDYGIAGAMLFATIAKGSGEGVKFKEYKMPFDVAFQSHNRQYQLQKLFDLPKLDMEPGDQLYFYVEAQDTHQQKTRTDVYTVTIQDTAALLSMNGVLTGSNIKPEFFRSERQIILDTEKLMRVQDSLTKDQFNTRSNELATDQKLLRLRYGKFLGEEDESDIGGPGSNAELAKAENFSNDKAILDAYTDKHDNAEDATFLEPAVKAQLKATLTEMWKAELQLRLYKPQAALPFEYKALRLLKDLQQKSRSYVAKTAYNPPPLKLEKRLTGELDKVNQPFNQQNIKPPADNQVTLKAAIQVLEFIKLTSQIKAADRLALQAARRTLSEKAASEPGIYLKAISALTQLAAAGKPDKKDILTAERAIQRSLQNPKVLPQGAASAKDMGLSGYYYQNLKRANR